MGTVGLYYGIRADSLAASLALKSLIPFSAQLRRLALTISYRLVQLLGFILSMFWAAVHPNGDEKSALRRYGYSEIAIVVSYLLYLFYFAVFRLWQQGHIKGMLLGGYHRFWRRGLADGWRYAKSAVLPVCLPICGLCTVACLFYSRYRHNRSVPYRSVQCQVPHVKVHCVNFLITLKNCATPCPAARPVAKQAVSR